MLVDAAKPFLNSSSIWGWGGRGGAGISCFRYLWLLWYFRAFDVCIPDHLRLYLAYIHNDIWLIFGAFEDRIAIYSDKPYIISYMLSFQKVPGGILASPTRAEIELLNLNPDCLPILTILRQLCRPTLLILRLMIATVKSVREGGLHGSVISRSHKERFSVSSSACFLQPFPSLQHNSRHIRHIKVPECSRK